MEEVRERNKHLGDLPLENEPMRIVGVRPHGAAQQNVARAVTGCNASMTTAVRSANMQPQSTSTRRGQSHMPARHGPLEAGCSC